MPAMYSLEHTSMSLVPMLNVLCLRLLLFFHWKLLKTTINEMHRIQWTSFTNIEIGSTETYSFTQHRRNGNSWSSVKRASEKKQKSVSRRSRFYSWASWKLLKCLWIYCLFSFQIFHYWQHTSNNGPKWKRSLFCLFFQFVSHSSLSFCSFR